VVASYKLLVMMKVQEKKSRFMQLFSVCGNVKKLMVPVVFVTTMKSSLQTILTVMRFHYMLQSLL
jgi:hypothetical protein